MRGQVLKTALKCIHTIIIIVIGIEGTKTRQFVNKSQLFILSFQNQDFDIINKNYVKK